MTTQRQYKAMSDACQRGTMPELPSPTWDINTPINGLGCTLFHIACRFGHESVVGQLLAVGASRDPPIDPTKTNGFGATPLGLAAYWGHEAVVRMLVARPDVDVNKECPLAIACRCHHVGVVVALLECPRVDVNLVAEKTRYQSINGQTALHVACEEGFVEGVKVLLKVNGIDTNCKNGKDTNHVMSHVEQGGEGGTWCNILPENNNNNCKCLPVTIVFEDLASFDEIVCASCPLQMVVKIIISRKFGVEPTQQLIFIVGSDNSSGVEELLSDPSRTLEEIHQQQQGNCCCSSTNRVVVSIQVRIKSSMTIQEKDLKVVSTLGVGSYGTVFKCSFFLPNNTAPAATSSSSSTSSEITTTTTSLVAVKSLHESIKSEFNITRRNIMHRDLSSNNVLLDSCGTPKIADFGVSRASVGNALPGGHRPTALGTFTNGAGTPIYLPPQMHSRHYGIQGDMWEFAVLLSELLQGTVPEVTLPKSFAKMGEFMKLQRSSLSSPEISEVDRLCDDVGDMPIAECLSRRIAIISALRRDPKMNNNNNEHRACVGLFSLVVESCLSILEINRPPFPAIEKMLMTCAEMAFTTTSSSATGTRAPTTATTASTSTSTSTTGSAPPSLGSTPWPSSATTTEHIATCLAGIVASLLPDSNS
ncbi:hypothetical protein Pelo_18109 [Pelomyxa schiedti]|nr:hypothetical protein Pelo_18109 [Pelomyxa schiedti]